MTVEEFKQVIDERFATHEKHEDAQHEAIIEHFERINGKVGQHDNDIRSLMIRDAFWAGGVVAVSALLRLIWK